MSRSQLVAEHLPLLRRYARALTGNQASGDAYVGAMLEALLQDSSLLDERHGPRAGLFRLFTQIWNSVAINGTPDVATLALTALPSSPLELTAANAREFVAAWRQHAEMEPQAYEIREAQTAL